MDFILDYVYNLVDVWFVKYFLQFVSQYYWDRFIFYPFQCNLPWTTTENLWQYSAITRSTETRKRTERREQNIGAAARATRARPTSLWTQTRAPSRGSWCTHIDRLLSWLKMDFSLESRLTNPLSWYCGRFSLVRIPNE